MKKLFILFVALATALFGADAANDVVLSQRKADNSGFIQRNVAPVASGLLTFDASKIPTSPAGFTLSGTTFGVPDAFAISSAGSIALAGGGAAGSTFTLNATGSSWLSKLGDLTPTTSGVGGQGFTVVRTISGLTPNLDEIRDESKITSSGDNGMYSSFDASPEMLGTTHYNHLSAYQDRLTFSGSGTLDNMWGFWSSPTVNSGTVTVRQAFWAKDVAGAGAVGTNYGLRVASLAKGSTNWAVYTEGTTPSSFGGNVTIGGTATITGNMSTGAGAGFFSNLYYSSGWKYVGTGYSGAGFYADVGGIIRLKVAPNNAGAAGAAATPVDAMTFTGAGAATLLGRLTSYNGIATAGNGIVTIQGAGRATAQTGANASVATYTVGASDASFLVSANVLVTTSSAESFTVTCAYTDESNTARTATLNFQLVAGTIGTAINFANGAVPYEGIPLHIRAKAATAITIATTGTFTGATYNVEGAISKLQ